MAGIWLFLLLAQTVKVAFLHHGNQSFADNGAYALVPGDPGYVGNSFHRTVDTHLAYGVPAEFHISGTLLQSYLWNRNDHGLLDKLRNPLIDLVGGSYAENILPYAEEAMNRWSFQYVRHLYATGLKPVGRADEPTVVWIPERVWKNESQMPYSLIAVLNQVYGKMGHTTDGQLVWIPPLILLDDNVHDWYDHTFPDGTPCHNPFKIHQMLDSQGNRVFVAFISRTARDQWVWNDVSAPGNPLNSLLWDLHDDPDQEQVVIYADDWEKAAGVAGWDFGQPGVPANSYDHNIAWAASQPWIQPVYLSEVAKWWGLDRIYDADPLNDPPVIDIAYGTYPELHEWTGGSYDNWYHDFQTTQAFDCGLAPDRNANGLQGDYEDLWKIAYEALDTLAGPDTALALVGRMVLMAMLYETAWHDGPGGPLSGWGRNLWNHSRYGALWARLQAWQNALPDTAVAGGEVGDFDGDGLEEYLVYNNAVALIFDRRGGRALAAADRNGYAYAANLMGNYGNEGDYDDGGHPGLFHDSQAENAWFQGNLQLLGDSVVLVLQETYDASGNPASNLTKTIVLYAGEAPALRLQIQSTGTNWTKCGVTPDLLGQVTHGYSLRFVQGITPNGWTYAGYEDTLSQAKAVFLYASGQGLTYHNLGKLSGGAELVELGGRQGTYTFWFYLGTGDPEVPAPGPGDLEGPWFWDTRPPENVLPGDSALVLTHVADPSGLAWVRIRYGINGSWTYPDRPLWADDGALHDWDGDSTPTPHLYGGWLPPGSAGDVVEFALHAQDSAGNESWDNNDGQNYRYTVGEVRFHMDGELDDLAWLLSSHGDMHLWAFLTPDSSRLYVATETAGDGLPTGFQNDHFIFLSLNPYAGLRPAPWAKSGQVAAYQYFLADENDNDWVRWYDSTGAPQEDTATFLWAASPGPGGVLEGVIHLVRAFGAVPETLYLAAASYSTPDGGTLQWQVPPGNYDGNLDPEEFYPLAVQLEVDTADTARPHPRLLGPYRIGSTRYRLVLQGFPEDVPLQLRVYNAVGRRVFRTAWAGNHGPLEFRFAEPSGVYFLELRGPGLRLLRKFLHVRE